MPAAQSRSTSSPKVRSSRSNPPADRRPPRSRHLLRYDNAARRKAGRPEEETMRAMRIMCASMVAWGLCLGPSRAVAQENPQALRQEIDQLRRDFEALKQQYGERLTALEGKLAAAEGAAPPAAPAAAAAAP